MRATASFKITGWEPTTYHEPAEGPPMGRVTVTKEFEGEITGTSTAELLTCMASDTEAGYMAQEHFTGRVGDFTGTFVMQHGAVRGTGTDRMYGYIVPGSGTGELAGIQGEAEIRHDEHGTSLVLEYDLRS